VRGDNDTITLGDGSQVQDGCVLHADPGFPITLGKGVSIGHKCMIHGCSIGDGTLIGINSVVLNGAKIGKNCVIGANSLITEKKVIPDGVMVMGSPGKVVRDLRPDEIAFFNGVAGNYAARAKRYMQELKVDDRQ
jgi:carbonic anhydrase/acetyltransferase-like protein (isoleucine patch superfamily)